MKRNTCTIELDQIKNGEFLMLSENEYNLICYCLEQQLYEFTEEEREDANNIVVKLSEHVTVDKVAHRHERRDLDTL